MVTEKMNIPGPQVHLARSTASRMALAGVCAAAAIAQSAWNDSLASLWVALAALAGALAAELAITFRRERFSALLDGSAAVSALVLTLLLPNGIHPACAFLGAAFAMAVVKHSFGGLGSNWLNPALGGWLFIRFSWPAAFTAALDGSNLSALARNAAGGLTSPQGSPLDILRMTGAADSSRLADVIRSFMNKTLFVIGGAELPEGYLDLFNSAGPGIIADRGLLALLAGTLILAAAQVNRAWIPAVFLFVYGLLIRAFAAIPFGGGLGQGDILFGFMTGGTLAAAFLLFSDPATGPKSDIGILAATILGAVFAWFFRWQRMEAYGAFFAAALVNTLCPLFRTAERSLLYKPRTKGKER